MIKLTIFVRGIIPNISDFGFQNDNIRLYCENRVKKLSILIVYRVFPNTIRFEFRNYILCTHIYIYLIR